MVELTEVAEPITCPPSFQAATLLGNCKTIFITLTEKLFVEHYEDYVLDKILLGSDNGDN